MRPEGGGRGMCTTPGRRATTLQGFPITPKWSPSPLEIYLLLAVLGLSCCADFSLVADSVVSSALAPLVVQNGLSSCGTQA